MADAAKISQLEADLAKAKSAIFRFEKAGVLSKADIEAIFDETTKFRKVQRLYNGMKDILVGFVKVVTPHLEDLRKIGITIDVAQRLQTLAKSEGMTIDLTTGNVTFDGVGGPGTGFGLSGSTLTGYGLGYGFGNGTISSVDGYGFLTGDRVVEVPVSDARTKHLIHMFAVQMKKFFEKYPKLREECDVRLTEFFQQELIDVIEVDEIDRIVEIVKYVPDVYRVENVYAYSSEKSRRVEFHLRVLIKALLEELDRLKNKHREVLNIDEGVIGMINAEIMDVVNVDDILKIFRVVPKIVEVEKIVEKIVDRIIEIPQVVPVEKVVEKIIEKTQIVEVEKIVHVPVEVVKYVDVHHDKVVVVEKTTEKIVEVPKIIEKIVDRVVEIPKLVTQEIIVEKIVYVDKPSVVENVKHVEVVQYKEVEVIKEVPVVVEKVIEKPYPVEVFVEKIVPSVIRQKDPQPVEVIKEVLVESIKIQSAREIINHVQQVPQIHTMRHEVSVPIEVPVEKVVEVLKVVEKIVEVRVEVPVIKTVEVIQEKIVYVDRIKEVEKAVTKTV